MQNLITIHGVRGKIENGVAYLNLEDVARGLGFTTVATSGNECVRWSRVEQYLTELGFNKNNEYLPDNTFIPENIFYRLAMKAKNEVAEIFQAKVADEILPSIRKHGAYITTSTMEQMMNDPDFTIRLFEEIKKERAEKQALQVAREMDKPKVLFADSVAASKTTILVGELAKVLKQNGIDIGEKRFFKWLRENKYLISRVGTDYNAPTQKSMELGLFAVKETVITHSDGHISINKTTKVTGKGQQYFINKFLEVA